MPRSRCPVRGHERAATHLSPASSLPCPCGIAERVLRMAQSSALTSCLRRNTPRSRDSGQPTGEPDRPADRSDCSRTLQPMASTPVSAASGGSGRNWGYAANRYASSKQPPTQTMLSPLQRTFFEQHFTTNAPNQVWTTDITYIATDEGWPLLRCPQRSLQR